MSEVLMDVQNLAKHFVIDTDFRGKPVTVLKAVDNVSFSIAKGEAFGLVGESGCGKTTLGKILVNLYRPTNGKIFFEGKDLTVLDEERRRSYCKDIQMIFQDPYASLNPKM
ncbi:MAG: ATP-binding cassette domain-containing protein, partial [Peptococcaceae bacterium]|nr:ATP-binding cassette domain-containing protein [Peptococcaceae bacterium]